MGQGHWEIEEIASFKTGIFFPRDVWVRQHEEGGVGKPEAERCLSSLRRHMRGGTLWALHGTGKGPRLVLPEGSLQVVPLHCSMYRMFYLQLVS